MTKIWTLPEPGRRERQVPAVGRPGRALVGALAEGQRPHLARSDVDHLDVVAGTDACGVGDLVERQRRPGRPRGIGVPGREPAQPQAVGADRVDLRRAGAIGHKGDLRSRRRPRGRLVDAWIVGQAADVGAVAIRDVQLGVAVAGRPERDPRPVRATRSAGSFPSGSAPWGTRRACPGRCARRRCSADRAGTTCRRPSVRRATSSAGCSAIGRS